MKMNKLLEFAHLKYDQLVDYVSAGILKPIMTVKPKDNVGLYFLSTKRSATDLSNSMMFALRALVGCTGKSLSTSNTCNIITGIDVGNGINLIIKETTASAYQIFNMVTDDDLKLVERPANVNDWGVIVESKKSHNRFKLSIITSKDRLKELFEHMTIEHKGPAFMNVIFGNGFPRKTSRMMIDDKSAEEPSVELSTLVFNDPKMLDHIGMLIHKYSIQVSQYEIGYCKDENYLGDYCNAGLNDEIYKVFQRCIAEGKCIDQSGYTLTSTARTIAEYSMNYSSSNIHKPYTVFITRYGSKGGRGQEVYSFSEEELYERCGKDAMIELHVKVRNLYLLLIEKTAKGPADEEWSNIHAELDRAREALMRHVLEKIDMDNINKERVINP
jgi:hypothetical protein